MKKSPWLSTGSTAYPEFAPCCFDERRQVGARRGVLPEGYGELPARSNYFLGSRRSQWRRNVPTYSRVRYPDIYPGIDMVYYVRDGQLEYDFVVRPGANPDRILLATEGDDHIRNETWKGMVLGTRTGEVRLRTPMVYQERNGSRVEIAGRYVGKGGASIGFEIGEYDRSRPLVIDPVLIYSSFLGGALNDWGYSVATDGNGNAFITGETTRRTTRDSRSSTPQVRMPP